MKIELVEISTLIGRQEKKRQIVSDLTKTTPSHVSIIGPRSSGKSILLKTACKEIVEGGADYSAVDYWDFSADTPATDELFLKAFAQHLADAIRGLNSEYADYLSDGTFSVIREVVELLHADGIRVLMAWDGFDRPLLRGNYSANLWDNLCNLAEHPSWKVITATRKPLQELISQQDSWTSNFWGTFGRQIEVSIFKDADFDEALAQFPIIKLEKGALAEIKNWTGFYPPLVISFLEALTENVSAEPISAGSINTTGQRVASEQANLLRLLWQDCGQPAREVFLESLGTPGISDGGRRSPEKVILQSMGLIEVSGTKIRNSNRLMESFVGTQESGTSSLAAHFASAPAFSRNQIAVLQLRLNQIDHLDDVLRRNIGICLGDLPDDPRQCVGRLRGSVCDRAIELLLRCELGNNLEIPTAWVEEWRRQQRQPNQERFLETGKYPRDRAGRVQLLRLIANPWEGEPKAKRVSPLACELVQILKRLGDFTEHPHLEPFSAPFALSAVSMCIELAAVVARDLYTNSVLEVVASGGNGQ